MMPADQAKEVKGTVLSTETPFTPTNPNEYEYPFPSSKNQALYQQYRTLADSIPSLLVCGRLGEYKYYDMDQAIGRAMMLAEKLLESHTNTSIEKIVIQSKSLSDEIAHSLSVVKAPAFAR